MVMKAAGIVLLAAALACEHASAPLAPQAIRLESDFTAAGSPTSSAIAQSAQDFPFSRILCFGDSLTSGPGYRDSNVLPVLAPMEGYVPKLGRLLSHKYGSGIELINSGIGGETTSEGLQRLSWEIRLHQPDLVLLLEGVVDVNADKPRFAKARNNLSGMMSTVLKRDIAVIVGTTPPLNPDGFRIWGIQNIPRLNDLIRREANQLGVPVADHERTFGDDLSLLGPDGLHPNANGNLRMAETWLQVIEDLVES